MLHIQGLYIAYSETKGRGVYTAEMIAEGSVIEVCPVIIIPEGTRPILHRTVLHDYYFEWGEDRKSAAIALGYGSLYNHDADANAHIILDFDAQEIVFEAIIDILPGSEICIDYRGQDGSGVLWF